MQNWQIEDEYRELYQQWQKQRSPQLNARFLQQLDPVIRNAIQVHTGSFNPLIYSQARRLALEALERYDPTRAKLHAHLYQHLRGLKRINRQQTQAVRVPERLHFERYYLDKYTEELTNELGRSPSDQELADRMGVPLKRLGQIRRFQPEVNDGRFVGVDGDSGEATRFSAAVRLPHRDPTQAWTEIVYSDLDPYHQQVMEYTLGLHGKPQLANQDIAKKLKRSPGAISQAKARIQKMLDEGQNYNPFREEV